MVVKLKNFMGVYLWGPFAEGYMYIYIHISKKSFGDEYHMYQFIQQF